MTEKNQNWNPGFAGPPPVAPTPPKQAPLPASPVAPVIEPTVLPDLTPRAGSEPLGYTPTFWEKPENVVKYRDAMKAGKFTPEEMGIDPTAVSDMYNYMLGMNEGKLWTEWKPLAKDDPARAMFQALPDPDALWAEMNAPEPPKPEGLGDVGATAEAMKKAPLLMKAAYYMRNNPWAQGAAGGALPGAVVGGVLGAAAGPLGVAAGAAAWATVQGAVGAGIAEGASALTEATARGGAWSKYAWADKVNSFVSGLLGALDVPASILERALGMPDIAYGALKRGEVGELLTHLDDAWNAAGFYYESLAPALSQNVYDPNTLEAQARPGDYNVRDELFWAYDQLKNGAGLDALREDMAQRTGLGGEVSDLLGHIALDPLNLVDVIGTDAVHGLGRRVGLDAGTLDVARAGAAGPVDLLREYSGLVRQRLTAEEMAALPGTTGAVTRFFAGVDEAGLPRELGTEQGGLLRQTKQSRMEQIINRVGDNLQTIAPDASPDEYARVLAGLSKNDFDLIREQSSLYLGSSEGSAALLMLRDFEPKVRALLDQWHASDVDRGVVQHLAEIMKLDETKVISEMLRESDADLLLRRYAAEAQKIVDNGGAAAVRAQGILDDIAAGNLTGAELKRVGEVFKTTPYNDKMFRAYADAAMQEHFYDWGKRYYGIEPDSMMLRFSQTVKNAQSLVLLGYNPNYLANNVINNYVTMAASGVLGLQKKGAIDAAWEKFGVRPKRLDAGLGQAMYGAVEGVVGDAGKVAGDVPTPTSVISDAYKKGGKVIRETKVVPGTLEKVNTFVGKIGKTAKVLEVSGNVEAMSRSQAATAALKRIWPRVFKRGIGYDELPDILVRNLPGETVKIIEELKAAGVSGRDLRKALVEPPRRRPVISIIDEAAQQMGMSDDMRGLLDQAGIIDYLEQNVPDTADTATVRRVFEGLQDDLDQRLNDMAAFALEEEAVAADLRIRYEGSQALLEVFDRTEMDRTAAWWSHFNDLEDLFARQETMSRDAFDIEFKRFEAGDAQRWKRLRDNQQAQYAGVMRGLGVENAVGQRFLDGMSGLDDNWVQFDVSKRDIWREYVQGNYANNAERMAAKDATLDRLSGLYNKHAEIEGRMQAEVDNLFLQQFVAKYGQERAGAVAAWRTAVWNARAEMVRGMNEFRDTLRGMTPADRRAAWSRYLNQEQKPRMAERLRANMEGAARVFDSVNEVDPNVRGVAGNPLPAALPDASPAALPDASPAALPDASPAAGRGRAGGPDKQRPYQRRTPAPLVEYTPPGTGPLVRQVMTAVSPTHVDYSFEYRVVPLDSLIPSQLDSFANNPVFYAELQGRARERLATEIQVNEIARTLNPNEVLLETHRTDTGAPFVGSDMMVEAGNGRVLGFRTARRDYPESWARYQASLRRNAANFGMDANAFEGMKDPVLVRVRTGDVSDRVSFAADANVRGTLAMATEELARIDSARMVDTDIAALTIGEKETVDKALLSTANSGFIARFLDGIGIADRAALLTADGKLNQAGLTRLKAAMLLRVFPDDAGTRLVRSLFETTDGAVKNVERALYNNLHRLGQLEAAVASGALDTNLSIAPDLLAAADQFVRLKRSGMSLEDYLTQMTMFADDAPTEFQAQMLRTLELHKRSPNNLSRLVREYTEMVGAQPPPGQMSMMADVRLSKQEAWSAVAKKLNPNDVGELEMPVLYVPMETPSVAEVSTGVAQPATAGVPGVTEVAPVATQAARREFVFPASATTDTLKASYVMAINGIKSETHFVRLIEKYAPGDAVKSLADITPERMRAALLERERVKGIAMNFEQPLDTRPNLGTARENAQATASRLDASMTTNSALRAFIGMEDGRTIAGMIAELEAPGFTVASADGARPTQTMKAYTAAAETVGLRVSWEPDGENFKPVLKPIRSGEGAMKHEAYLQRKSLDRQRAMNEALSAGPPPVGAPLGAGVQFTGRPEYRAFEEFLGQLRPVLGDIRERMAGDGAYFPQQMGALVPDALRADVDRHIQQYDGQLADAKVATMRMVEQRTDAALLNYGARTNLDNYAMMVFPYELWSTRSMFEWAVRAIDQPAWLANYARIRAFQERGREQPNFPSRLAGKIKIPMPFLPDWAGDAIYIDPMRAIFPYEQFGEVFKKMGEANDTQERRAGFKLQEWLEAGEITQDQYMQALGMAGDVWTKAMTAARADTDAEIANPWDLVSTFQGPSLPIQYAINAYLGKQSSMLPVTTLIRNATAMVGLNKGRGINIESGVRKYLGMPEGGEFWDYYTDRMLASMAADHTVSVEDAKRAMIDRAGPVFELAQRRTQTIEGWRYLGRAVQADFMPQGEENLRALQDEYSQALTARDQGDKTMLTKFYDEHPEYEARGMSMNWDDPEGRLKNYLVGEVWDAWYALPELTRREMTAELGPDFEERFLTPATRDPQAIDTQQLADWVQTMGGKLPESVDGSKLPIHLSSKEEAQAYESYIGEARKLWPDIGRLKDVAYNQPDAKSYYEALNRMPRLREYKEWQEEYLLAHPEAIRFIISDQNELSQETPETALAVMEYRVGLRKAFPDLARREKAYYDAPLEDRDSAAMKSVWAWKDEYAAAHPEMIPFIFGDSELGKAPPEVASLVVEYRTVKREQFPNIDVLQDEYFALDVSKRSAYLKSHPELKRAWDWDEVQLARYPQLIPYVKSDASIGKKMYGAADNYAPVQLAPDDISPPLARQLLDYYVNGTALGKAANGELRRVWEKLGKPGGKFETFVNVLLPEAMGK